jgi:calcineurin-like phosphoesterase family protein
MESNEKIEKVQYNVFFIADLHIQHKNILHHSKERISAMNLKDSTDIEGHDEYIINLFHNQVKRGDHVYILGDFIMSNQEVSRKIIQRIKSKGCILHLIVGNHDKSTEKFYNDFESIDLIKVGNFKKTSFPFIEEENFQIVMCHYPMKSWFNKCRGSLMMYGHIHWNSPWTDEGNDLSLNVGFDNPMCNYQLFTLEQVYEFYKKKLNGLTPKEYSDKISEIDKTYIR